MAGFVIVRLGFVTVAFLAQSSFCFFFMLSNPAAIVYAVIHGPSSDAVIQFTVPPI